MSFDLFSGQNFDDYKHEDIKFLLSFEDDGKYWFLNRYFEAANLDSTTPLMDLYGSVSIEGYQLDRLEDELKSVLLDVVGRPEQWPVLTGWSGKPSRSNEIWKTAEKHVVISATQQLLSMIQTARDTGVKIFGAGD